MINLQLNQFMETLNNEKAKNILLCVSGGIDSMALLYSFYENACGNKLFNGDIHVVYVNHGISKNAHFWGEFVENEVNKLNKEGFKGKKYPLNIIFKKFELNLKEKGENLSEQNLRNKRYEAIFNYCVENNIKHLATAHHRNDYLENNFISIFKNRLYSFTMNNQSENVIYRNSLNEKSFLKLEEKLIQERQGKVLSNQKYLTSKKIRSKLKNLLEVENGTLNYGVESASFGKTSHHICCYKPLLEYTKKELETYLQKNELTHIHDESNEVSDNIRNVIRNELFGKLSLIKGFEQYHKAMETFFEMLNFSFNFYTKIIKNKILPKVCSYSLWANAKDDNSRKEIYCLEVLHLLPYLNNMNYFLGSKKDVDTDEKFMIELLNLFFYSKTGYYLTGKHKKFLKTALQPSIVKGKKLTIIDDNKVCFKVNFEDFLTLENLNELTSKDLEQALKTMIINFELDLK